jgi:hypothetical protein
LPPCLIGMEACSTAHFRARELAGPRPRYQAHACGLCEAVCQTRQKRCP